jgi:argininosuccinate lyase
MARAASDPMLLATDLAEHLVGRGVPFREAHEVVGRLVAHALEVGTKLDRLERATLLRFHPALDVDPATFFSVERSLEARNAPGGPAREAVRQSLAAAREELRAALREIGEGVP